MADSGPMPSAIRPGRPNSTAPSANCVSIPCRYAQKIFPIGNNRPPIHLCDCLNTCYLYE